MRPCHDKKMSSLSTTRCSDKYDSLKLFLLLHRAWPPNPLAGPTYLLRFWTSPPWCRHCCYCGKRGGKLIELKKCLTCFFPPPSTKTGLFLSVPCCFRDQIASTLRPVFCSEVSFQPHSNCFSVFWQQDVNLQNLKPLPRTVWSGDPLTTAPVRFALVNARSLTNFVSHQHNLCVLFKTIDSVLNVSPCLYGETGGLTCNDFMNFFTGKVSKLKISYCVTYKWLCLLGPMLSHSW